VTLLLLAACASDAGGDGAGSADENAHAGSAGMRAAVASMGPWTSLAERPCPDGNALSYENFGAPFFLNYCEGCHGSARRGAGERQNAPLDTRFDDLAEVRKQAGKIWLEAADDNRAMPPVGGPPQQLRVQLGEWLACGAPAREDLEP
jgi:hypothetical protein